MSQFLEASKLFNDNFDLSGYLDSYTFEIAKKELLLSLNSDDTPMIFLLGDPGVGKSFLLNFIQKRADSIKIAKFYSSPNFTNKELLEDLLENINVLVETGQYSQNSLIENLKIHYKNLEYVVFIDEAQLMSEKQLEFLRVLSDLKIVKFVLAMHKKEGERTLSKSHFKSRTIKKIVIESLTKEEIARYIQNRLLSKNYSIVAFSFQKKEIKFIKKISFGNFRTIKKLVRTVCEIVDISQKARIKEFEKIDKNTLTMAAIDIGLIDVK